MLIGFVFAAFLKLSTIGIALLGVAIAYLGTMGTNSTGSSMVAGNVEFQSDEEEELDL